MVEIFEQLSDVLDGPATVALAAAFVWGILSVLLSPCHLASIPLIVAFINGQGSNLTTRRAFCLSTLFAVGILITIAALGVITSLANQVRGDIGPIGNYVVAGIFFLVGLHLLGVIPMPWSGPGQVGMKRKGLLAAFILGLVFGIALGPCTFAFMAPVLGAAFAVTETRLWYGILLLTCYGLGHSAVIALAGTCTELMQRYLHWTEKSKGTTILRGVCGVLVIVGGLYFIYTAA